MPDDVHPVGVAPAELRDIMDRGGYAVGFTLENAEEAHLLPMEHALKSVGGAFDQKSVIADYSGRPLLGIWQRK
jgi:hypothetical protein